MIWTLQRKPFVSLCALVVVNLLLLSVQVRNEEGRVLLRSWSLLVFTPIATTVHFLVENVSDALDQYAVLYRAQEENRKLRAENAVLKIKLSQLRGLSTFLSHRGDLSRIEDQFFFDTLPAAVIWKSPPFYAHRLVVNVGSRQRVNKDDAVITPEGIAGRVWATTPFTAEVELLTNAGAAAGAMLEDSRLQGVVQGDGSMLLTWDFIPNYEKVEVGDIVYTSGTDRVYPKGLPIGQVVMSENGTTVYREIQVKPFVDYLRLEEVLAVIAE